MEVVERIESKTTFFFIENGVLFSVYKEGADVELEDVKENISIRIKLQKGEKMPALVDVRKVWQYSDEARAFVAKEQVSDLTVAMAILTGQSMPVRIVANFFINFNKPINPI